MKALLYALLKYALSRREIELISRSALGSLQRQKARNLKLSRELQIALICLEFCADSRDEVDSFLTSSRSQLGQDVFAYLASGRSRGGFFVEFGAGDGINLSNTALLEREFGWVGILAEPNPDYHANIQACRSAILDTRCVWRRSGETLDLVAAGYLSTIEQFRDADSHAAARSSGPIIAVETVSLWDLLEEHGAPTTIDFLSIDTEGSEHEILSAFPFGEKYSIRTIACEHNYSPSREAVAELLEGVGYRRVAAGLSAHDDWFVLAAA